MRKIRIGAASLEILLASVLTFSSQAQGQVVERGRTLADLIASHPCDTGLTNRIARVTDCDAADDFGNGGGAFQCWAYCDGSAPWTNLAIGAGGGGGLSDADYGDVAVSGSGTVLTVEALRGGAVAVAATTGNLQWEGTTADAFEGNFTFADPTADWTWAWSAEGQLAGPAGTAAAPTYSFAGDSNTGIYSSVGDQIYFANGGASTLRHIQYETQLLSLGTIEWGNSNDFSTISFDTVLKRHAAGVLRVGSSTTTIRSLIGGGSAVASATAMPAPTGRVLHVTGTTTITSITSTDFESGVCVTLIFDDALTFTDGNNLKLAGNFVTTADDTWSGCFDGANWYESSRSIN